MVFEWSWESGELLADWKLANIVPVFKMGKKDDPGQFRPAGSLTAVPVKFTNKVILRHVEKHLKDRQQNNWSQPTQLHEGQVGFTFMIK